jgi:hypothetical protein
MRVLLTDGSPRHGRVSAVSAPVCCAVPLPSVVPALCSSLTSRTSDTRDAHNSRGMSCCCGCWSCAAPPCSSPHCAAGPSALAAAPRWTGWLATPQALGRAKHNDRNGMECDGGSRCATLMYVAASLRMNRQSARGAWTAGVARRFWPSTSHAQAVAIAALHSTHQLGWHSTAGGGWRAADSEARDLASARGTERHQCGSASERAWERAPAEEAKVTL